MIVTLGGFCFQRVCLVKNELLIWSINAYLLQLNILVWIESEGSIYKKGFKYTWYAEIKVLEILFHVTLTGDTETTILSFRLHGHQDFACWKCPEMSSLVGLPSLVSVFLKSLVRQCFQSVIGIEFILNIENYFLLEMSFEKAEVMMLVLQVIFYDSL